MSMADCPKCWDVLCTCGYEYLSWKPEDLGKLIATLQRVHAFALANPRAPGQPTADRWAAFRASVAPPSAQPRESPATPVNIEPGAAREWAESMQRTGARVTETHVEIDPAPTKDRA